MPITSSSNQPYILKRRGTTSEILNNDEEREKL